MLTPAYAPTATERVLPRLALDFTTAVLDPRVTVTRALNTATRVNSSGLIEIVNADLPRFDYNPVTNAARGLLIEDTRANLALHSQALNNAVWLLGSASISPDAAISPDGTQNADKFIPSASGGTVSQNFTKAASAITYTFSFYAKADGLTSIRSYVHGSSNANRGEATFNLSNGTTSAVQSVGTFTNTSATITAAKNGYYRCTITTTSNTDTGGNMVFRFDGTTGGSNGILLYGVQLEAGGFATSYIPTTTTSLTRNADTVTMTGTNFSSWFNASEGTFVMNFTSLYAGSPAITPVQMALTTLAGASGYVAYYNGAVISSFDGTSRADANIGVSSWTGPHKVASTYKGVNKAICANAGAVGSSAYSGTWATATGFTTRPSGHVQKLSYYPIGFTSAELQAFTK